MSDVSIDTTGMVRCGHPGCHWLLVPGTACPEHSDGEVFWADPDDPASVAEAKRRAIASTSTHEMSPPPPGIGGEGQCSCGGTPSCPDGSGHPPKD